MSPPIDFRGNLQFAIAFQPTTCDALESSGPNKTTKTPSANRHCRELFAGSETIRRANHTISIASP